MSKQSLDSKKIRTILIEVSAEGVTEGVAGQASGPAKALFMGMDMAGKVKSIDGFLLIFLLIEKKTHRSAVLKPVLRKKVKSIL